MEVKQEHEVIAITGHRPESIDSDYTYTSKTWKELERLYEEVYDAVNPYRVLTGCALGVDTVAAEVAMRNGIPYTACVPFAGQEARWPKSSKERYERLLANAEGIIVVTEGPYAAWKMHKRNEFMVDHSTVVMATWNGSQKGGTFACVKYAMKQHGSIIRIDPKVLQWGWQDREGWEPLG